MPYLDVKIVNDIDKKLANEIASVLTELTNLILNKKRELTAVSVSFFEPTLWFIDGKITKKPTYYICIKITEGTNTKVEKEYYIKAVHDAMNKIFGAESEEASYILIDEIKADAWGYSGKTQEFRHINTRQSL